MQVVELQLRLSPPDRYILYTYITYRIKSLKKKHIKTFDNNRKSLYNLKYSILYVAKLKIQIHKDFEKMFQY